MILVCVNPSCGCHFKPNTRHMRYKKGDLVQCGERCGNQVKITLNVVPEQDFEIVAKGIKK